MNKLVLCFLLAFGCGAHAQNFEWARNIEGSPGPNTEDIAVDIYGNVYSVGSFTGTLDLDPGPGTFTIGSQGGWDIYLYKLDPAGNFLWGHSFGANGWDHGLSVDTDSLGNVYFTGDYQLTVDFDPGIDTSNLTSAGSYDAFVCKLDSSGNFKWVKGFEGGSAGYGLAIAVGNDNAIYTSGYFAGTTDFDPSPSIANLSPASTWGSYVCRLDSTGNYVWAALTASNSQGGHDLSVDANGSVYVIGEFAGTQDLDPGPGTMNVTASGNPDAYITKLSAAGNLVWVSSIGGAGANAHPRSIVVDDNGSAFFTGHYTGTVDFDPGPGSHSLTNQGGILEDDAFTVKLNPQGGLAWVVTFPSSLHVAASDIQITADHDLYILGSYEDSCDFDPGPGEFKLGSSGLHDVFLCKLDTSGGFLWAGSAGSSGDQDFSTGLDVHGNCTFFQGDFNFNSDLDPSSGVYNYVNYSGAIIKLSEFCTMTTSTINPSMCDTYTTPSGGATYTSSGTYLDTLTNAGGCDSVITINLTINTSTAGTDVIAACNNYTWIDGNTYTSNNFTATHTLTNMAGCDSLVTLNLTINTVDTVVSSAGITLTAAANGATYQWLDCDNGMSPINGETGQSFTPISNGNYAVVVDDGNCIDTSGCHNVMGVGIVEHSYIDFHIYPNPSADGRFTVELVGLATNHSLIVRDALGRVILNQQIQGERSQIDAGLLSSGTYLVEVRNTRGVEVKRFVVR